MIMSYKPISLIASFLIAALVLSSLVSVAYGQAIVATDTDADTGADPDFPSECTEEVTEVNIGDVAYYVGLTSATSATGIVVGTIAGQALTEYFQSMLIQRAVVAGYEGPALYSQIAYAHMLAGAGGIFAGIAVGLVVVGTIFLIGYLCYG